MLRAADLTRDGRVDHTGAAWRRLSERDCERRLMQDGDLILERSGGGPGTPVGRIALIDGVGPVYCNNFCQQLRVDSTRCTPKYTARALWHRYTRGVTARLEHQTTGIRNLDYGGLLGLPHPPPASCGSRGHRCHAGRPGPGHRTGAGRADRLEALKAAAADALLTGRVRVEMKGRIHD